MHWKTVDDDMALETNNATFHYDWDAKHSM